MGKGVVVGAGSLVKGPFEKKDKVRHIDIPHQEVEGSQSALREFFPLILADLQMVAQLSGEARNQKLKEIEGQIRQAGLQLSDPSLEDQLMSLPSAEAQQMRKEVEDKQRHLITLQEWFEEEVRGFSPKGARSPKEVAKETKAEQKNSLLSSQEKSSDCIKSSKRMLSESQATGTASLQELQRQRESMQRSQKKLGEANEHVGELENGKQKKKFLGIF